MLEGKELLEKAKLLSKKSEDEIAKGCGYVGPSGRVLRKSFYKALIEAKGYKIMNKITHIPSTKCQYSSTASNGNIF